MFSNRVSSTSCMVKVEFDPSFDFQEEEFVPDHRASMSPSEIVQSKLLKLMPDMPVPVSCLHTLRDTRRAFTSKG